MILLVIESGVLDNNNPASAGQIIANCTIEGTAAITFDDGPSMACIWTHELLDFLKNKSISATFFVNGNNVGCIYDYADIISRIHQEGHQIGSHTWSHPDLTSISKTEVSNQIVSLEEALKKIVGLVPKYFRPPYGSYNDEVLNTIEKHGLGKYSSSDGPPSSHIVLNHDIFQTTCQELGPRGIQTYLDKGFKLMTVAECMGASDWYQYISTPSGRDGTWSCG
ncbi:Carbohydrate Esterase Family 4 protein [Gigaspora rosea]|uniref:Carbohydrate Esterase Family 4 protein n=1 Tax=Gigaspora rosea TaxID=44941 RepID=A0A397UAS1_9GLOM|nr:Carbohydrate Esterase Family 4 protein [Gigaspora rosea]